MHLIRGYVTQNALVVGHHNRRVVRPAEAVHTVCHDAQGVNVQPGVGFIQEGKGGFQQRHLQHFVALFLAAGEAFVDRPTHQFRVDFHLGNLAAEQAVELSGAHLLLAQMDTLGVHRGFEELPRAHAGQFHRILKGQEHSLAGPVFRLHVQEIHTLVHGRSTGDGVFRAAGQGVGQGALAGPVGAHDRVNFARIYGQVHAPQYFLIVDGHPEVLDLEDRRN